MINKLLNIYNTKTIKYLKMIHFGVPKNITKFVDDDSKIKLDFSLDSKKIEDLSDEIIKTNDNFLAELTKTSLSKATFETVIKPLSELESWSETYSNSCIFPQFVHLDKSVRQASKTASEKLESYRIQQNMREDIYNLVKAVYEKNQNLDHEDSRILNKMINDYKRNGMHLKPQERQKLKKNYEKLSKLSSQFQANINEDETYIILSEKELKGMQTEYINRLEKSEDKKFKITMKYPDIYPLLEYADSEKTRKKAEFAYQSRCKENTNLLKQILELRRSVAAILGYKNYAQLILEEKMAKSVEIVEKFLKNLIQKVTPIASKELEQLKTLKRENNSSSQLYSYDTAYYKRILMEKQLDIDQNKISEYFPAEHVVSAVLQIYETVLHLKFTKKNNPDQIWTTELADLFEVRNKEDDSLVGYFYLDLYPRNGKYSHAACFPIQPGCIKNDKRQLPVAAMVANFTKPSQGTSLLKHNEVVTFFHELGHVMHHICSKTKYSRFHGCNVEGDFVEAPSQMLENWCWDHKTLKKLSCHYKTKDQLSDQLIQKLIKTKNYGAGMAYIRQLFFASYDMYIHTNMQDKNIDTSKLYNKMRSEITLVDGQFGTFPEATFGHIVGGYEAGYYGYLWSQVYSADMFESKFNKNKDINDPETGKQYRNSILKPGGSKDGIDMLTQFIGRKPNSNAFIKSLVGSQTHSKL